MKYVNFILLFLCTVFAFSCNNEDIKVDENRIGKIKASIIEENSRTSVNSNHQILWNEDDKISVFGDDGENRIYILSDGEGGTSALFTGKGGENKLAFYPYCETTSFDAATQTLSFVLPDKFTYNSNTINQFPMIGRFANGSDDVSFKNIGALLSVTIINMPFNYTYVTLRSNDEPLAGNAEVTWSDGIPQMTIIDDESASKSITINFGASESSTTRTFHFMLPVEEFSNLTLQAGIFEGGSGTTTIKSAPLNVIRNGHYELTYYSSGSYAVKSDGSLVPAYDIPENLTDNEKENYIAVAIIDEDEKFMLSKSSVFGSWGNRTQTICEKQYTGYNGGQSDKAGKENTDRILSEINLASSGIGKELVSYRESSVFKDWYIPSAGQAYYLIYQNKGAIDYVLSRIGNTIASSNYWTSTEYNKEQSWYITDKGEMSYNYKDINSYRVWFMRDF